MKLMYLRSFDFSVFVSICRVLLLCYKVLGYFPLIRIYFFLYILSRKAFNGYNEAMQIDSKLCMIGIENKRLAGEVKSYQTNKT